MFFDIANTALSVLVVGTLISLSFLLPERDGYFLNSSRQTRKFLVVGSSLWVIASIGKLLSTLANIFESDIGEVLKYTIVRSFITQVTLGKLLVGIAHSHRRHGQMVEFSYLLTHERFRVALDIPQAA